MLGSAVILLLTHSKDTHVSCLDDIFTERAFVEVKRKQRTKEKQRLQRLSSRVHDVIKPFFSPSPKLRHYVVGHGLTFNYLGWKGNNPCMQFYGRQGVWHRRQHESVTPSDARVHESGVGMNALPSPGMQLHGLSALNLCDRKPIPPFPAYPTHTPKHKQINNKKQFDKLNRSGETWTSAATSDGMTSVRLILTENSESFSVEARESGLTKKH